MGQLDDHPNAHRISWQVSATALAVFTINWGGGYAFNGNKYAVSPALDVVKRVPGHMRTPGWIALLIGVALIYEAANLDDIKWHWPIWLCTSLCIAMTVFIVGSWTTTGKVTWSAPWAWVAFGIVAGCLLKFPPPPKWRGGDRA